MKSHFYHIQINIDFSNLKFYKELFDKLGWSVLYEDKETLGYKSFTSGDLWFVDADNSKPENDYDGKGMNHIAIRVGEESDIDKLATNLKNDGVDLLFNTPRHREEFILDGEETYYQVMFKSPDNILFEIVYVGGFNFEKSRF